MGYYSYMSPIEFKTDLSEKEFKARLQEFQSKLKKECEKDPATHDYGYFTDYDFLYNKKAVEVIPFQQDYYQKHYACDRLVEFISQVISGHVHVTFEGDDGESWGYYIAPGQIRDMVKEWRVLPNPEDFKK